MIVKEKKGGNKFMEQLETGYTANKEAWLRYFARIIDMTVGTSILGLLVGLVLGLFLAIFGVSSDIFLEIPEFAFMFLVLIIYLFLEANIISSFGTTPGKKLFGISISDSNGEDLDYTTSVQRNFTLWMKGLAFSIPFISLITLAFAHSNYTATGITSWDKQYNIVVTFKPISDLRFVLGVLLWIAMMVLNFVLVV